MAQTPIIADVIDYGTPDSVYETTPVGVNSTYDFTFDAKVNGSVCDLTDTRIWLIITRPNNDFYTLEATITDAENGKAVFSVGFNDLKKVGGLGIFETWRRQWQFKTNYEPSVGAISPPFEFQVY